MRRLPVLRALQTFEQAARHPSFSAAALSLGMTHGAISHQIRSLEEWLGKKVFDRRASGVCLNAYGRRLHRACNQSFSLLEQEIRLIQEEKTQQLLSIGCSTTLLSNWLLPRIDEFLKQHPDTPLSFHTRGNLADLSSRRIDILITSDQPKLDDGIHQTRLGSAGIGPVCAPNRLPLPQHADEMTGMPLLHASSRLDAWQEWAAEAGSIVPEQKMFVFETLSLAIEAACSGLGFAMTPDFVVRSRLERGQLVAPLGFIAMGRAIWLCIREADTGSGSIPAFRDWLLESASSDAPAG